jgi:N-acetylmuramoyl-L-alanine amidase
MNVGDIVTRNEPGLLRGLDLQIIAIVNAIVPNILIRFDDLDVDLSDQINPLLQSAAKESLRIAIRQRGRTLLVNSAYRTVAQQYLLRQQFERGLFGIPAAAVPGASNHESGLALDVEDPDGWQPFFQPRNWIRLGRDFDFPHYDYIFPAATRNDIGSIGVTAFQRLWNQFNPSDRIAEDGAFGLQTERRLASSPINGFMPLFQRSLQLQEPRLQGEDVAAVQQALLQSSLVNVNLRVTGIFDQATERAVIAFQQATGRLAVDGVVGPATLGELGLLR